MACRCKKHIKFVCLVCGKSFERCRYQKDRAKFCSRKCRVIWVGDKNHLLAESKKVEKVCQLCGKKYLVEKWREKKTKYCSQTCQISANIRCGEKNNLWQGGITPINRRIRTSSEYKNWRRIIFERDDYTCQICGKRGVNLRANHIKKFSDYPELRFEFNNGITICSDCDLRWVLWHEPEWGHWFRLLPNWSLYEHNTLIAANVFRIIPAKQLHKLRAI